MPQIPTNSFNVGTDLQNPIITFNNGVTIPLLLIGHIEEIDAKNVLTKLSVIPVTGGGAPIHRNIYHGWEGSIKFTRFNGGVTGLIAGVINQFQTQGLEAYFTLSGLINNTVLGTQDPFAFTNCVFDESTFGAFGSTKEVKQDLPFRAQALSWNGPSAGILTAGLPSTLQP